LGVCTKLQWAGAHQNIFLYIWVGLQTFH